MWDCSVVVCFPVSRGMLFSLARSQTVPGKCGHFFVDLQRPRAAADDIAPFGSPGVLLEKCQQMPGVLQVGMCGPFHFYRRQFLLSLDNEIHFSSVTRSKIEELPVAEILEPFPQLDAHPLFEQRPRVCLRQLPGRHQAGCGVAHAQVEEEKLGR